MKKLLLAVLLVAISTGAQAETILVSVNGLVCAFCATGIEKTFQKQDAVDQVKVDLDNKLVTINTKPAVTLNDETVTKLITDAGYNVTGIKRNK